MALRLQPGLQIIRLEVQTLGLHPKANLFSDRKEHDNIVNIYIIGKLRSRGTWLCSWTIDIGNGTQAIYILDLFFINNGIVDTVRVHQGLDLVPRWRNGLDDGNWRWMWQSPKGPEFYPRWEMSEGKDWCLPLACRTSISNFTVQDPVTHTLTGAPTEGKRRAASAR